MKNYPREKKYKRIERISFHKFSTFGSKRDQKMLDEEKTQANNAFGPSSSGILLILVGKFADFIIRLYQTAIFQVRT